MLPSSLLRPESLVAHLDRMRRTALGLTGTWHEAEDLVQETCAQLLARPRRIHGDELAYVLTTLRNIHFSRHRTAARRPASVELGELTDTASTFETVRDREVHGWLDDLPGTLREAIVAVDVVGLGRSEAAYGLGISERVLEDRLKRARISVGARLAA